MRSESLSGLLLLRSMTLLHVSQPERQWNRHALLCPLTWFRCMSSGQQPPPHVRHTEYSGHPRAIGGDVILKACIAYDYMSGARSPCPRASLSHPDCERASGATRREHRHAATCPVYVVSRYENVRSKAAIRICTSRAHVFCTSWQCCRRNRYEGRFFVHR